MSAHPAPGATRSISAAMSSQCLNGPVGAGDAVAFGRQALSDQGDGFRAPARPRNGDERHAPLLTGGEQLVDDRLADRTRLAGKRLQVRQQAGAGVHFDDGTALHVERHSDVGGHYVQPRNIESDRLRRQHAHGGDVRVKLLGLIDREITVVLHEHGHARFRH
jgi:hypothetical protein